MEWFLTREVVVGLAIPGAVPSAVASTLQRRGGISAACTKQLNLVGYGVVGLSMVLCIVTGFRAH